MTKLAGKTGKYGIIRHRTDILAATAFSAIGTTANQWTNPVLAATNFRRILLTALTPKIDPQVTIDDFNNTSQLGLNKEYSNFHIDKYSNIAKFNYSALADLYTLSALLIAQLQGLDQVADAPYYRKTITSGFTGGTINFNGNGGYTFGMCEKIGASADDGVLMQNGIGDSLKLTIDFNAKGVGRLVGISGTLGFKSVAFDQTLTGTFVDTTFTPFNNTGRFYLRTFACDGVDLKDICIRRIEITMNNSLSSNCHTTDGAPNQFDVDPDYLINIIVDHGSLTEKLRGDFVAGADIEISLINGADDSALGYFEFNAPYCKMISEPSTYNDQFYGYNLSLRPYQNGTTSPITFIITDHYHWDFQYL